MESTACSSVAFSFSVAPSGGVVCWWTGSCRTGAHPPAATGQGPYLVRKHLRWPNGAINRTLIREGGENFPASSLVVPLTNEAGELVNVQLIRDDGTKRYLAGGQKAGAYHRIEGGELVVVVEGSTPLGCNDEVTEGNPGRTKAEQAAAAVGGLVALPPVSGDWNDHHQAHGLTATKEAIMSASTVPTTSQPQNASQKDEANVIPLHPLPMAATCVDDQGLPEGFEIKGDRLCAWVLVGRGEDTRQELVPISSPIRVLAETSDEHGRGYGRLLEWRDSAGRVRQWAMPVRSLVPRNGDEVFVALLDAGLPFIELGHKRKLNAYLMACKPERRITCVERTGWHGRAYVLPHGVIGPEAEG